MSGGQDFSEDITNGGFASDEVELHHNEGDEDMVMGAADGDLSAMNQDDSMQGASGSENATGANGDGHDDIKEERNLEMEHSVDGAGSGGSGNADQKLFIGGLSWETTEKDLREYFSKFGNIESLTLKMDPATGRSRGFAFIVFSDVATLDKVIAAGEHVINGKKVDPKKAKARHGKIFVGGLTQEISDEDIKSYFQQFGNVVEVEMPIDKVKNQRKGFCFITFDNEQIVHELLKKPKQTINGKEVDVKKAQPPQNARSGMMPWGTMGVPVGRGSRGTSRGRGGRGRGDWNWGGSSGYSGYGGYSQGYGPSGARYGGYGDYYGGGYSGYGGYSDYYGGNYGYAEYDTYDAYSSAPPRAARGRGGSFSGKTRGTPRGQPRHMPY